MKHSIVISTFILAGCAAQPPVVQPTVQPTVQPAELPMVSRAQRAAPAAAQPAAGDVFIHVPPAQDEPIKKDSHPCWDKVKDAAATTTTVIVNKYEEAKKKGHVKRLKDAAKIVKNKAVEAYNEIK